MGSQCHELRINDGNQAWRIVYHVATGAVVILDVFSKKTAATPNEVLMNCRKTPCSIRQRNCKQKEKAKMIASKKARLERNGWAVGDAAQFLNLNPDEAQFIEMKLALAAGVRQLRERCGITQAALAEQLGSSQSRVAKMEAADRSVTIDLMMRSLLAMGATPAEIARLIQRVKTHRAA
jgi:DNA-binding XRE family transcriptional regulator